MGIFAMNVRRAAPELMRLFPHLAIAALADASLYVGVLSKEPLIPHDCCLDVSLRSQGYPTPTWTHLWRSISIAQERASNAHQAEQYRIYVNSLLRHRSCMTGDV